jgi:hypothetical protein
VHDGLHAMQLNNNVRPHWNVMKESGDDNRQGWMTWLLCILAWVFAIYILFFVLIVLDECWLETRFFAKHAPPWAQDAHQNHLCSVIVGSLDDLAYRYTCTMNIWPNALQRTTAGYRGCNRRALWPPSLGR